MTTDEVTNDDRFFELVLSDLHKDFTTDSPPELKAIPVEWRTALLKILADTNASIKALKESTHHIMYQGAAEEEIRRLTRFRALVERRIIEVSLLVKRLTHDEQHRENVAIREQLDRIEGMLVRVLGGAS